MNFNIQIDQKELQKQIKQEIQRKVNQAVPKIQSALNQRFESMLLQRFVQGVPPFTPRQVGEIGVPDLELRIQSILREAAKSFEIRVQPANLLKINISILKKDHADLLSLPESVFHYVSRNGSGVLEYLRWLLLEGDQVIVNQYDFSDRNMIGSRTQQGTMVRGSGWKMPQDIAGVAGNNILTNCLNKIGKDIESIVSEELNRLIK